MTDPARTTLQVTRVVPAPRDAVYAAWTEPDLFRQWFGPPGGVTPRAEMDVRAGGTYRIEWQTARGTAHLHGTYLDVEAPERLVYTFCWDGLPIAITDTRVTVEFRARGAATEVVLTHERQPSRDVHDFHAWGWSQSLTRLQALLQDS
jgi:uncharacterized protein YndB with AHSA1/START domain